MPSGLLARACAAAFCLFLVLGAAQAVEADSVVTGTGTWTMVGAPSIASAGLEPSGTTMWSSSASAPVTAIVILVVRNSLNQTVYYSTGTLTLPPHDIGSAQDVIFGIPNGSYTATFFAFTFAGVAISTSTTVSFTLPL